MELVIYFIACVLIGLSIMTIINILTFPQLEKSQSSDITPFVSILIPARNEAHIIQQTVSNILAQTYPSFEVIVLDDNSTDGTGESLAHIDDSRLTIIKGKPLPAGWMGKSWACHQLSQLVKGDILVFTDADVQWSPDALTAIIRYMLQQDADLFTVWSTQETITPTERLTVPLMAFAILTYLPTFMTHHSPFSVFAAANGQCMVWKRSAYDALGGHKVVANSVLDDVDFARHVKKENYKLRMADANKLIQCHMYDNWESVRDGFSKNILAGYGNSVIALSLSILFHFVVFLLPVILLITTPEYRFWAGVFIIQAMLIRALSASFTQQRLIDAIGMPVSVILMTRIAMQSIVWHYTGQAQWKGRNITSKSISEGQINV